MSSNRAETLPSSKSLKRKRTSSKPAKKKLKTDPDVKYEPFQYTEVNEYKCSSKPVAPEKCQCSPPGTCGTECWNRMLQIECTIGTCPCGVACTNNRFQKRQYPKLEIISAGDKGNGIKVLDDLTAGQFVVEYVGEVVDVSECPERMKGRRHFYFLSIDGQTGIDASRRGNLARFINHSCDPNCATQKWTVKGRTSIGIFAIKDIPSGTELTFDYKFERIGCKKQRCLCGSAKCRGWLGAKPVEEDEKKPSKISFSNHNRYAQHLYSRVDLETIDEAIKEEIPNTIVKNAAKGGAPIFLNRAHRAQKQKHVMELHKFLQRTYDKELTEFEQHEEMLRKRQTSSSLLFMDVERSAKSGFAYFDDSCRDRRAKSAANQRLTTNQSKAPPKKTTRTKPPAKKGRPRKNPDTSSEAQEQANQPKGPTEKNTPPNELPPQEMVEVTVKAEAPEALEDGGKENEASVEAVTLALALEEVEGCYLAEVCEVPQVLEGTSGGPEPMNVQEGN